MKYNLSLLTVLCMFILNTHAQSTGQTGSLNNYSFDLYREIKTDNDNLFVSPLSTYIALLMAYEGSASETRKEFEKILHIDNNDLTENYRNFISGLTTRLDSSNYLTMANAIWIQNNFEIENRYKNNVERKYLADVKPVDFSNRMVSSAEINRWVSDNTNGLIKEIISPPDINTYTRLVISDAIYFVGKWASEFDERRTQPDDFYTVLKNRIKTYFMNQTERLRYFENNDFQFVSIPYKGNDKSFCIFLPRKRYGISDVENELNSVLLDSVFNNLIYPEVKLSIPKFKLECDYSLVKPLKDMGLKEAFSPDADFSGITKKDQLSISNIKHKAYIDIDEKKTEAAAATVIMMLTGAAEVLTEPMIFKADHPFIFMILDNKTRGIIFIGKYVKPQ